MTQIPNTDELNLNKAAKAVAKEIVINSQCSKKELTAAFEEYFGDKLDFKRSSDPHYRYEDRYTQALFMGFKTAFTAMKTSVIRLTRRAEIKSPFIIGTTVVDGTVQFSYRPHIHSNIDKARKEAMYLNSKYGKSFTVFGAVAKVQGPKTTVEQSKQGVDGKIPVRINAYNTMAKLQKFLKETKFTNVPLGVILNKDGAYKVVWSYWESGETFETYELALESIGAWLRDMGITNEEFTTQL